MNSLSALYDQIDEVYKSLQSEREKTLKGNKASAKRSRKSVLALSKLFKEFRKMTLASEETPA